MANFLKHALLIIMSLSTSIGVVQAKFDQDIVAKYMNMASDDYKIGGHPVSKVVQAANFLAHEIALEANLAKAEDMADTLFALVSKGEGVGGISKRPANDVERPLMINALREAEQFLQTQGRLTEAQLGKRLKTFDAAKEDHERQHLAHVAGIVFGAFKRHEGMVDRPTIGGYLQAVLADTEWLSAYMTDDEYWKYVDGYLAAKLVDRVYNVAIQVEVDRLRAAEQLEDGKLDYEDEGVMVGYVASLADAKSLKTLEILTKKLTTTVIPKKARHLSRSIWENLKGVDFTAHVIPVEAINAIIAAETYRMFETRQGRSEKFDPSIFVYQQASPESEAILLALVSAVQSILFNPDLTDDEVVAQFKYKIPKSPHKAVAKGSSTWWIELEKRDPAELRPSYAKALELIEGGQIKDLLAGFSAQIKREVMNITKVQKLIIDAEAMKQRLFYVLVPVFDFRSAEDAPLAMEERFMRFVKSLGDGQCGWYSLRHTEGYAEYIQQILDNLDDPEIYRLVVTMTGLTDRWLAAAKALAAKPDEQRSAKGKLALPKLLPILETLNKIQAEYDQKSRQIEAVPNPPKQELEAMEVGARKALETKIDRLQTQKQRLYDHYDALKRPHLVEIVKISDPDKEMLVKVLIEDVDNITTQSGGIRGWYTSAARKDWRLQPWQPDFISVILNGYDVYSWLPISVKKGRSSIVEDGQTALIGFTSPRKDLPASHPRRIHLYNESGGGHYDKWVEVGDTSTYYADMAAALRHKHRNGLVDTGTKVELAGGGGLLDFIFF